MEFKGTKGRWIGKENGGVYLENGVPVFETGCGCCTSKDLNAYDALLISKAPEMLEMLKEVVDWEYVSVYNESLYEKIEQLIKEATEL